MSVAGKQPSFTGNYNNLNEITAANGQSFTYDAAGQLLNDGKRQFTWDAAHRLVSVKNIATGALTQYQYDGLSRRIAITYQASPSATPVTTNYLWCGEALCQSRDATNTVRATYYTQGQLNGNAPLFYARNHLGSVMNLIDGNGKTVTAYAYSPYGRTLAEKTSSGQSADFRYAGMFYDGSTGLYLTHHRAYSPEIRRWVSRDPLGEGGGLNVYNYVASNPLRWTDPTGLELECHYVIGGYYNKSVEEVVKPELGYWKTLCIPIPKPQPALPDPIPGKMPGFPIDPNIQMDCSRTIWVVTQEEERRTKTERWMWGWMECTDTCTGKVTKVWMPDRPADDPPKF